MAGATRSLRASPAMLALALAADRVQRRVGASHSVEVVADDPRPRQLGADCLPIGVVGIDRDHLDRPPGLLGQRAQETLDAAVAGARRAPRSRGGGRDRTPRSPARGRGGDGPRPATAAVAVAPREGLQLVAAVAQRARDLIADGLLLAATSGCAAMAPAFQEPPAEARRHALTGRQLPWVSVNVRPQPSPQKCRLRQSRYVGRPASGRSRTCSTGRSSTRRDARARPRQQPARAISSTSRSS
jgi:hypothetical protein